MTKRTLAKQGKKTRYATLASSRLDANPLTGRPVLHQWKSEAQRDSQTVRKALGNKASRIIDKNTTGKQLPDRLHPKHDLSTKMGRINAGLDYLKGLFKR